MKKNNIKIIIFFVASIISIFLFLKNTNQYQMQFITNNKDTKIIQYIPSTINPIDFYPPYQIDLPLVSTSPSKHGYFFELLNESKNTNSNKHLYYAGKRIAELDKWGHYMTVATDTKNVDKLLIWWRNKENWIGSLYNSGNYNSWEASLARYYIHVHSYINAVEKRVVTNGYQSITDIEDFAHLYAILRQHELKINTLIFESSNSTNEKRNLSLLNNTIFINLYKQISHDVDDFDPTNISFYLSDIFQDRQFGLYSIYINGSQVGDPNSPGTDQVFYNGKTVASNIQIGPNSSKNIQIKNINLKSLETSTFQLEKQNSNEFHYASILPDLAPDTSYLLHFTASTDDRAIFAIEYFDLNTNTWQPRLSVPLFTKLEKIQFKTLIYSPTLSSGTKFRFTVSSKKLILQELIKTTIYPNIIPSLQLKLINSDKQLPRIITRSSSGFPLTFIIKLLSALILIFIIILLNRSKKFKHTIITSSRKVFRFCIEKKNTLLILALLTIAFDIFVLRIPSEIVIIIFSIFWLATTLGFQITSEIHFFIAAMFLVFYQFFVLIDNPQFAEKSVVWGFVFIIFGILHLLVEANLNSLNPDRFPFHHRGYENIQTYIHKIKMVLKSKLN